MPSGTSSKEWSVTKDGALSGGTTAVTTDGAEEKLHFLAVFFTANDDVDDDADASINTNLLNCLIVAVVHVGGLVKDLAQEADKSEKEERTRIMVDMIDSLFVKKTMVLCFVFCVQLFICVLSFVIFACMLVGDQRSDQLG